jgi:hypothetical protein
VGSDKRSATIVKWTNGVNSDVSDGTAVDLFAETSGNGQRVLWRRNLSNLFLQDQNGVVKPIQNQGNKPAAVMLDHSGSKVLYCARDEDGDQDMFLADLSKNTTIEVSAIKGMDEYEGYLSGDGKSVVFTGLDRRKDKADMNVYLWNEGKTEQLTWNDGGLNTAASVSHDGSSVSWFWIDQQDTTNRKVLLWKKDPD